MTDLLDELERPWPVPVRVLYREWSLPVVLLQGFLLQHLLSRDQRILEFFGDLPTQVAPCIGNWGSRVLSERTAKELVPV